MALTAGKIDEIVKEYLLFRGLIATSKQLDTDLKNEKEKKFRVDKMMETLHTHINGHDLGALREYWQFLEQRLFSRLEQTYAPSVRKLETSLLKLYVVNAIQTNKSDKVTEFFERMTPELQGQAEWREWFVLPFTKAPEDSRVFAMYFTRQWQDTLFLTLHNFLSVIIRSMVLPSAFEFEEEARKISKLEEENAKFKNMIAEYQDHGVSVSREGALLVTTPVGAPPGPSSFELMDDFSVISQDSSSSNQTPVSAHPRGNLRSFIRNISSSPIMGRKTVPTPPANKQASSSNSQSLTNQKSANNTQSSNHKPGNMTSTTGTQQGAVVGTAHVTRKEDSTRPKVVESQNKVRPRSGFVIQGAPPSAGDGTTHDRVDAGLSGGDGADRSLEDIIQDDPQPFILVNQDDYAEHKACITHCRFNHTGRKIASADMDGIVKVWTIEPTVITETTNTCKSAVLSLDWTRSDKLILGTKAGMVRLYDVKEKKIIKEVMMDSAYPRVVSLACSPVSASFVCSAVGRARSSGGSEASNLRVGRLAVWDMKTMKVERGLPVAPNSLAVNWSSYNHNGQLVITGASDGHIRLFDTRKGECISSWTAHQGEVYSVVFSQDETSCYSMGSDGKFMQWSVHKTGGLISSIPIHQGAAGPFVYTGHGGYRQVQTPKGKLFALEPDGDHILTCAPNGAQIYKMVKDAAPLSSLFLGGHRNPVVSVDWSPVAECRLCVSGSMDGRIKVSSITPH